MSETENIRKNLAIERMIVEGCDILLDVNQVFVRQGTLIQVSYTGLLYRSYTRGYRPTFGGMSTCLFTRLESSLVNKQVGTCHYCSLV